MLLAVSLTYFYYTAGAIIAAAAVFLVIRFFRRLYLMVEEIDDHVTQLRTQLGARRGRGDESADAKDSKADYVRRYDE